MNVYEATKPFEGGRLLCVAFFMGANSDVSYMDVQDSERGLCLCFYDEKEGGEMKSYTLMEDVYGIYRLDAECPVVWLPDPKNRPRIISPEEAQAMVSEPPSYDLSILAMPKNELLDLILNNKPRLKKLLQEVSHYREDYIEDLDPEDDNAWAELYKKVTIDVSGGDLANADLSNLELARFNFEGCNLSGVQAQNADFRHCSFVGANLTEAQLTLSELFDCDLTLANLSKGILLDATMNACNLQKAEVKNTSCKGLSLSECVPPPMGETIFIAPAGIVVGSTVDPNPHMNGAFIAPAPYRSFALASFLSCVKGSYREKPEDEWSKIPGYSNYVVLPENKE